MERVNNMFCKHCGKEIAPDAHFCGNCGTKIQQQTETPTCDQRTKGKNYSSIAIALGLYGGGLLAITGFALMFTGPIIALIVALGGIVFGLPIIGIIAGILETIKINRKIRK